MTTWQDINLSLSTFSDDVALTSYVVGLRREAWNRANEFFAVTHTAKLTMVDVPGTPFQDGMVFALPADCLQIGSVLVPNSSDVMTGLDQGIVKPGEALSSSSYYELYEGIYLPTTDYLSIRLWYFATYPDVTVDASPIEAPRWAHYALLNLTMAYMLNPFMLNQQTLRSFQSKREAGAPEDNPPRIQAEFFIRQYRALVDVRRPQVRETL